MIYKLEHYWVITAYFHIDCYQPRWVGQMKEVTVCFLEDPRLGEQVDDLKSTQA